MNNTEVISDTTMSFEQWVDEWVLNKYKHCEKSTLDGCFKAMWILKESPAIVGYLNTPTGYYQNKVIAALSRRADSITEIKDYFDNCNKKIIMYDILHIPSVLVKGYINPTTVKYEKADEPFMSKETWVLRYVEI